MCRGDNPKSTRLDDNRLMEGVSVPLDKLNVRARAACIVAGLAVVASFGNLPAAAQDAEAASAADASEEYARILQQIADTRIGIARQELLVQRQQAQIQSLQGQIASVPQIGAALPAVLSRFSAGLEAVLENDPPFLLNERFERYGRMEELFGEEDAKLAEKVSRALQVAGIEATYGYEISAYPGDHPLDPRRRYNACEADLGSDACALTEELQADLDGGAALPQLDTQILDGDYIRYGRLSLAYVDLGTDDVLVYDPTVADGEPWREARGSEVSGIRRNLRIARGEAAPDMVEAPVVKAN